MHAIGEGERSIRGPASMAVISPLLDLNKEAQNHCDPYNGARDVRMVARIR